jgi:hypothetical protein
MESAMKTTAAILAAAIALSAPALACDDDELAAQLEAQQAADEAFAAETKAENIKTSRMTLATCKAYREVPSLWTDVMAAMCKATEDRLAILLED